MRRAARIDDNQKEIVRALRSIPGVTVVSLAAVGRGVPDILVGRAGKNYLLEIKDSAKPPSERKLTPAEQEFHDKWTGHCAVVMSVNEALSVVLGRGR